MSINEQALKGGWHTARERIQQAWGKLTDDELDQINGNPEKLFTTLQSKYGYGLEETKMKVERVMKEINSNFVN